MIDVKEWGYVSEPDDILWGWQIYKNSIYLLQESNLRAYVKVLTPNHTYIYDIGPATFFDYHGLKTSYSKFEVLDEGIVLYGHVYMDLNNLMVFVLDRPIDNEYPLGLKTMLPVIRSVKKLNNSTWVMTDGKMEDFKRVQAIYLFQRTSYLDCMNCDQRKRVLEAMGLKERADMIDCKVEEAAYVPSLDLRSGFDHQKTRTSKMKTFTYTRGLADNPDKIEVEYDITECLDNFKKLSAALNAKSFTGDVENYYKQLSLTCNPEILKVLPQYIVAFYKSKDLHEKFVEEYYGEGDVDYDWFFSQVDEIAKDLTVVVYGIMKLSKDLNEALQGLKKMFQYSYLWGILYFKLNKNNYKDQNGNWKKVNPYSDLSKVNFDDFYAIVVQAIAGLNLDLEFPFHVRKIKVSQKKNFSQDAVFFSLGPAGCLSRIEFEPLPHQTIDAIVDVELVSEDKIILWTWCDVNAWQNLLNNWLVNTVYPPEYKWRLIELDLKTRKSRIVLEEVVPRDWHPLDHRKMAVFFDESGKYVYIREYFISKFENGEVKEIDYIEVRKMLNPGITKILQNTKSVFVTANLNNVRYAIYGRYTFSASPGFPKRYMQAKDLGSDVIDTMTPFEFYSNRIIF